MRIVVVVVVVVDDDLVVLMGLGLFYLGLGKFKSMAGQRQLVIYQSSKGEFASSTRKSKERCAHISVEFWFFVNANLLHCLHNFQNGKSGWLVWTWGHFHFCTKVVFIPS